MVYFGYHLVNPHVKTVQNMYGILLKKNEEIAIEWSVSAIFGDFWGREPRLYSKISEFGFLSVSFDFLHEITLYAVDITLQNHFENWTTIAPQKFNVETTPFYVKMI